MTRNLRLASNIRAQRLLALLVAVVVGVLAVMGLKVAGVLVALAGLVALGPDVPVYLVILLFAGRFRGFPFADVLPEWVHASFVAAAALGVVILIRVNTRKSDESLSTVASRVPIIAALIMMAWALVAWTIGDVQSDYAWDKTLGVVLFCTGLFVVPAVTLRTERDVDRTLLSIVGIATVLAVGALATSGASSQLSAFGGGPNVFSRFTGMGAIISLYYMYTQGSTRKLLAGGALVMFSAATVLSGSRGSLLALGAVLVGYGLWMGVRRRSLAAVAGVMLACAVGVAVLVSTDVASARLSLLFQEDKGTSVAARQDLAAISLRMAGTRPVTGRGPGTLPSYLGIPGEREYAHNVVLELLAEYGVIGLGLFVVMVLSSLVALRRCKQPQTPVVVSLLTFSLLVVQVSGDLFDTRIVWFYSGLAVALTSLGRVKPSRLPEEVLECSPLV